MEAASGGERREASATLSWLPVVLLLLLLLLVLVLFVAGPFGTGSQAQWAQWVPVSLGAEEVGGLWVVAVVGTGGRNKRPEAGLMGLPVVALYRYLRY